MMAKLPEYFAPKTKLQPSERGYQAYEVAGRRLGGMYAETARSEMERAKVAGEVIYNTIAFPALLSLLSTSGTTNSGVGGGVGVKTIGGSSGFGAFSGKGGGTTNSDLSGENAAAASALGETPSTGAAVTSGGFASGADAYGVTVLRGGGTGGSTPLDKYVSTMRQLLDTVPVNPTAASGYWSARSDALSNSPPETTYSTGLATPSGATSSTDLTAANAPDIATPTSGSSDTSSTDYGIIPF